MWQVDIAQHLHLCNHDHKMAQGCAMSGKFTLNFPDVLYAWVRVSFVTVSKDLPSSCRFDTASAGWIYLMSATMNPIQSFTVVERRIANIGRYLGMLMLPPEYSARWVMNEHRVASLVCSDLSQNQCCNAKSRMATCHVASSRQPYFVPMFAHTHMKFYYIV